MIRVALTGNIASGKSTVQKILEDKGFKVFDADKIGHKILENEQKTIIDAFSGYDISENNKISRQKLGKLVFENEVLRKKLESIVHPEIEKEILKIFKRYEKEEFVFVGIPLLYEAKMDNLFDKIIVICTDENLRIKRIIERDNLSKAEAQNRINSQMPQDKKIKLADFVIENNSDYENLKNEVDKILKLIK